ncbi:hypothetical protein [Halanaerobacter jeridensis]|uniref:Uncharacterized protein n=1 Tax=Halanaerobacter jeridensis TaxID=706427 RepID=A0A938XPL4_9FIRM|nr:hypothetical protein [Halanaerobacter jeridensis]MBM7556767.1 hypothetical protein [Halanaerobacter jeridensis]
MGETKLSNKAGQLFDYLNDVVKLGYKPTYRLEDHNHFLVYQDQLPKS